MKLRVFLCLAALLLASSCAYSGSTFPFPDIHSGLSNGIGFGYAILPVRNGWFEGKVAWFLKLRDTPTAVCIDLDYRFRYPKLASAIGNGAGTVYQVTNFQQGPVFSSRPGRSDYSGIWEVVYITWKKGVQKRPIISHLDLPPPTQADYKPSGIVVDRTIVAIGPLFEAFYSKPDGTYIMPQVGNVFMNPPRVSIPGFFVYGQDKTTRGLVLGIVQILDIADPDMAALFQANYAPALAQVDADNVQNMWAQDWRVMPPVPPGQNPVVDEIDYLFLSNPPRDVHNFDYSPVKDLTLLARTTLPAYTVVQSPAYLQQLLADGALVPTGPPVRINAPMVGADFLRTSNRF